MERWTLQRLSLYGLSTMLYNKRGKELAADMKRH